VGIEILSAVEAFTSGPNMRTYHLCEPLGWYLMTRSGNLTAQFEQLVGLRLDDIVYDDSATSLRFCTTHEGLPNMLPSTADRICFVPEKCQR